MTELEMRWINAHILKLMSAKELNKLLTEEMCPPGYSPAYCDDNCDECWLQAIKAEKQITLEQHIMLDILKRITGIPVHCRTYNEAKTVINNHKDDIEREIARVCEATLNKELTEEE